MPVRYTPAQWRWFDRQRIDPTDNGQVATVSQLLGVGRDRVHEAIRASGSTRGGDIRKWLAANKRR